MKRLLVLTFVALVLSANQYLVAQTTTPASLAGSWSLTFKPGGSSVTPVVIPSDGLATFTADGSVVETDASEFVAPVSATPVVTRALGGPGGTPGHGIWQTGGALGTYYIQFTSLYVNTNGSLYARKVVTITAVTSETNTGTQISGNYTYQLTNSSGQVMGSGVGTLTGAKMTHPALP
jgi:hypothetical protein